MPKTKSKAKPKTAVVANKIPEVKPKNKPLSKGFIIAAAIILIIGVLGYFGKGFLVAAIVNGTPISRISIDSELEKQSGQKVLDAAVTKILISQELKNKNITVSDKEVNDELKKIDDQLKTQNQSLDSALSAQGMTKSELVNQIKIQKGVEKLLGGEIKISDEEISKFLTDNQQYLPTGKTDAELKQIAVEQLKQQKLDEKYQTWISGLQSKASVYKFVKF
jgi:parvulin-like peptidyl-prolyl isomerase